MTLDYSSDAGRRISRKNAVRKADKAATCPHCGSAEQWRRIAALWKAAYAMRDDVIADIAYTDESKLTAHD